MRNYSEETSVTEGAEGEGVRPRKGMRRGRKGEAKKRRREGRGVEGKGKKCGAREGGTSEEF